MHPNAMDLHYASNSLKELCALLSDPEYVRLLKATVEKNTRDIVERNRWAPVAAIADFVAVIAVVDDIHISRKPSFIDNFSWNAFVFQP